MNSSVKFNLIRNRKYRSGLYQVKMRATYKFGRLEVPVILNGIPLRCRISNLQNNTFYHSVETNVQLQKLKVRAIALAEGLTKPMTSASFRLKIYSIKENGVCVANAISIFDLVGSLYDDHLPMDLVWKTELPTRAQAVKLEKRIKSR